MPQRILIGFLALAVLVALGLWRMPDEGVRATAPAAVAPAASEPERSPADLVAASEPVRRVEVSLDSEPGNAAVEAEGSGGASRSLNGRILLDGRAPPADTRVYVQVAGATPGGPWVVGADGGFAIEVPDGPDASLSFRLGAQGPRALLLPRVPVAGLCEGSAGLDWRTRHLNVRVSGDPAGWNAVRLRVTGPDVEGELEVGESGRASLAVALPGPYVLEARHASGAAATARVEVGDDDDLDTVVLVLGRPE